MNAESSDANHATETSEANVTVTGERSKHTYSCCVILSDNADRNV